MSWRGDLSFVLQLTDRIAAQPDTRDGDLCILAAITRQKNGRGLFSLTLSTLPSSNQLPFTLESPSIYSLRDLEAGLNNNIFMSSAMHKAIGVQTNLNRSCKHPPLTQISQEELSFMQLYVDDIRVDSSQLSEVPNMGRGLGVARRLHINVRLNLLDILLLINHFLDHRPWPVPRCFLAGINLVDAAGNRSVELPRSKN